MAKEHLTIHQLPGSRTVTLYCGRCTGALHLALPVPLDEIVEASRQFAERHAKCAAR
jgi:hypothetical protein